MPHEELLQPARPLIPDEQQVRPLLLDELRERVYTRPLPCDEPGIDLIGLEVTLCLEQRIDLWRRPRLPHVADGQRQIQARGQFGGVLYGPMRAGASIERDR